VNHRPPLKVTSVGGQKLGGEIIRAFHHHIDSANHIPSVVGQQAAPNKLNGAPRQPSRSPERSRASVKLVLPNIICIEEDLSVQIALVNHIVIAQQQPSHASVGEGQRHGTAQTSEPHHEDTFLRTRHTHRPVKT
jgi:hypothetical protein